MTALNTLRFKGFMLRPAGLDDYKLADDWVAADKDHAGKIDPLFWLEQRPGVDSVLMLDDEGPVFFFKCALLVIKTGAWTRPEPLPGHLEGLSEETLRELYAARMEEKIAAQVFIQFMPCRTARDLNRTRTALTLGLEWLEPVLEQGGAQEIFFDSGNEKLIAFCVKRLGFTCPEALRNYYDEKLGIKKQRNVHLVKKLGAIQTA